MPVLKNIILFIFAAFCFILLVVFLRAFTLEVKQADVQPCKKSDFDFIPASSEVIERFRSALRIQTVAREKHDYNRKELRQFGDFIKDVFPNLHASPLVQFETVNNYSLLYTIKGSNSKLTPYLLMAHLDVVPADPSQWELPPFAAEIKDGFIYARGTIDFKQGVMGILEALNYRISQGIQPERGFYVAFGHDEEVGGPDGAAALSNLLWERGVRRLEFVVDEGLTVSNKLVLGIDQQVMGVDGALAISDLLWGRGVRKFEFIVDEGLVVSNKIVLGVDQQTALIGTSEKGQLFLELSVTAPPGHSSMPLPESTIGILAKAVSRLEDYPQPSMFGYGPESEMLVQLAPFMRLPYKVVMSNLWLFHPLISWIMAKKPVTNALIRTVTAVTMFNAGIKINVNAPEAKAYINHRIHPAQTVQQVMDYDKWVINNERVKIKPIYKMEPHPISPCGEEDFGYQTVKNSIRQIWNNTLVAPGTMIGNTDTKHYIRMCKNIYRFSPTVMWPEDVLRFHGDNERMSIKNYEQVVNFYYHLMMNADKASVIPVHKHGEL